MNEYQDPPEHEMSLRERCFAAIEETESWDKPARAIRDALHLDNARKLARERRWTYQGKARVEHPKYGSVIVPHGSNFSAIMNAAEYWRCDWLEISKEARVWACDQSLPVVRPREFCKKKSADP